MEDGLFGCDLKPILSMMERLGMKNMLQKDPGDDKGKRTYADSVILNGQPTLTLGSYPTSPLELTSAYAVAANDGIYCAPSPVLSIADKTGKDIAIKRTPCTQVITPQIARQAATLMTGDTNAGGTAANIFKTAWYGQNKSLISGKTGTDVTQPDPTKPELSSSFWFVGMTPNVVSTMALINVSKPTTPITGIPGLTDAAAQTTADGSVAAGFWLSAMLPSIKAAKWTWPSPNGVAGSITVANVVGQTPQAATATLTQQGFKVAAFADGEVQCGAPAQPGTIGYFGPGFAAPGTTITYCVSTGTKPYIYTAPAPRTTPSTPGATPPAGGGATPGTVTPSR
jgi:membrane peptidoglycan carboxypeptidase